MSGSLLWENVAAYSLQIGLLVAMAAAAPALLRLRAPGARLVYWQLLLVACLVLPVVRPWRQQAVTVTVLSPAARTHRAPAAPPVPARREIPWAEVALWALAAGAAIRLGWLGAGFRRLRRYRAHSHLMETAYDAEIRISPEVAGPVTFGVRRPVVLVPEHFTELPAAMQRAILCHEILHIERRDWLFTMAEELVRAVFWFHPAIWWVLGEIQLAREQAVDRLVVQRTEARDPYVDALLAMAGAPAQLDLAPAPLFLRKRHLKHRVVEIMKEAKMSKKGLISALTAAVALMAAACWFVTGAIPLAAEPQMIADAPGVTVNLNGAQVMHRSAVSYPGEAIAKGVQGTVVAQVTLDASGEVSDVTVLSGPAELRKAVIQSLLNWHFTKDAAGTTRTVNVDFAAPAGPAAIQPPVITTVPKGITASPLPSSPAFTLKDIDVEGLSDQARSDLLARLPVQPGDSISMAKMREISLAVREFDSHLVTGFSSRLDGTATLRISAPGSGMAPGYGVGAGIGSGVGGGVSGGVRGGVLGGIIGAPVKPEDAAAGSSAGSQPQRIRVGGNVQEQMLVNRTTPEYPALAKQARISGTVELAAVIGKDGAVINLSVVRGHPLLVQAALEAVKNWVYKPTLLNGQPVEVSTNIDVNFTLADQ